MIATTEGSFKAFLQEHVLFWEEKLYPLLDETLLEMPVDRLKPQLQGAEPLALQVDTTHLKKILPPDEARRQIEQIARRRITALDLAYREQRHTQREAYRETLLNLKFRQESLDEQIARLVQTRAKAKAALDTAVEAQRTALQEEIEALQAQIQKEHAAIQALEKQMADAQARIEAAHKEINTKRAQLEHYRTQQHQKHARQKARIEQTLSQELAQKRDAIAAQIEERKAQQSRITADARLQTLLAEQEALRSLQGQIVRAEAFIEAYQNQRDYIAQKPEYESRLSRCQRLRRSFGLRNRTKIDAIQTEDEAHKTQIDQLRAQRHKIEQGLDQLIEIPLPPPEPSERYLYELVAEYTQIRQQAENAIITLKTILQKLNTIKGLRKYDIHFDLSLFDKSDRLAELEILLINLDNIAELQSSKITTLKKSLSTSFENFVKSTVSRKLDIFSSAKESLAQQVARVNKNLRQVDFGVISDIQLVSAHHEQDSIATLLSRLREKMLDMRALFNKESLFFDAHDSQRALDELEAMFATIKSELKSDRISLIDTIDLHLSFRENGQPVLSKSQIKNESSTGGSMLLKIAIAISILQVYLRESTGVFFLIVDEVARLHSTNQKKLKAYANRAGFKIIFVTPEPVFANAKALKYYKFVKEDDGFMAIELNR